MEEKRDFFRLKIGLKVFIKKILFSNEDRYTLSEKWNIVETKDISANGMFILKESLKAQLNKNDKILIKLSFPNLPESIFLIGNILRENREGYAVNFIITNERDRDKLVHVFFQLSYEKNSKKDSRK